MWLWLAIIGNFALLIAIFHQHFRLEELHNRLCSIHDASWAKFSTRIDDLERRLGYEELESQLDDAVIWREDSRRRKLGSLFPRVAGLEVIVMDIKGSMETVFEMNNLKNWDSLSKEERLKVSKSEKKWP